MILTKEGRFPLCFQWPQLEVVVKETNLKWILLVIWSHSPYVFGQDICSSLNILVDAGQDTKERNETNIKCMPNTLWDISHSCQSEGRGRIHKEKHRATVQAPASDLQRTEKRLEYNGVVKDGF